MNHKLGASTPAKRSCLHVPLLRSYEGAHKSEAFGIQVFDNCRRLHKTHVIRVDLGDRWCEWRDEEVIYDHISGKVNDDG